jgi:hypothetical protein
MHLYDCLILDKGCGMLGSGGQVGIPKYLGTLGLSMESVTKQEIKLCG